MQQKLARAQGIMVHGIAVRERTDVGVQKKTFAIFEQPIGVFQVCLTLAYGLDLRSAQGDSSFESIGEKVVEGSRSIEGRVATPGPSPSEPAWSQLLVSGLKVSEARTLEITTERWGKSLTRKVDRPFARIAHTKQVDSSNEEIRQFA